MFDVLRDGKSRRLGWGADASGRFRAREYFNKLSEGDRAKFEPAFSGMAEAGKVANRERFVAEKDGIYCFKTHKRRIACFFDGRDVVLIYGFTKKETRSRRTKRELDTAVKLRAAYLARKGGHQR